MIDAAAGWYKLRVNDKVAGSVHELAACGKEAYTNNLICFERDHTCAGVDIRQRPQSMRLW